MIVPSLSYKVSRVFEIYSIGDGLFMKRVLDGIASMSNAGMFMALGALGLLIGILMISSRALMEGGQRVAIPELLHSFLLFIVMFGIRCDVVVHDMGGAPGAVQDGTYAIDNVPFGVAAAGAIFSTLGLELTEKFDQGFSLPSGSSDGQGASGFGRSLEWINAVRNWELPEIDDPTTNNPLSRFRNNVSSYIANCTLVGVGQGTINLAKAQNVADPFAFGSLTTGGIGYANRFVSTKWENADHSIGDQDCYSALDLLKSDASSPALFTALANATAVRSKRLIPGSTAEQQMKDAFADIGLSSDQATAYVATSAINAVWTTALRKGSDPSGQDVMSAIMVNQGAEQRATQWGADESMFRQVARPMTAFFESMIYALAPFMALVVGLGAWGVRKLFSFFVLGIWVSLWMPIAAIINLFQNTMVEHAVSAMQIAPAGGSTLAITSMAGAANLQHQIISWIATGATLVAATPVITMTLLFGGAVAATALNSKLQGAEFSNEKLVTPDAMKEAPVMERKSLETYDSPSGARMTGSDSMAPQYSAATANQRAISSSASALESASSSAQAMASSAIANSLSSTAGMTTSGGHTFSTTATQNQSDFASWSRSHGAEVQSGQEAQLAAQVSMALSGRGSLGAQGGGAGASLGAEAGSSQLQGSGQRSATVEKLANLVKEDKGVQATLAKASMDTVQQMASSGSQAAKSATDSASWQKAEQDLQQKQEQYSEAQSRTAGLSSSQTMNSQQIARALEDSGKADAVINSALEHAGYPAFNDAKALVSGSNWAAGTQKGRDVQAALIALEGTRLGDSSKLRPDHGYERESALVNALTMAGGAFGGEVARAATGDAARNAGLAGHVQNGAAEHRAASNLHVPSTSRSAVESAVAADMSGAADNRDSVIGRVGNADALGSFRQSDADLGNYRANSAAGMPLDSQITEKFEGDHKAIGRSAAEVRAKRAEAESVDEAGSFARGAKQALDRAEMWSEGTPSSSVNSALSVAAGIHEGKSEDQLYAGALGELPGAWHPQSLAGYGITAESALAPSRDSQLAGQINQEFDHQVKYFTETQGHQYSDKVITAMAAVATARQFNGVTPEVGVAWQSAMSGMPDQNRAFIAEWSDVAMSQNIGGGVSDIAPSTVAKGMNPTGMDFPAGMGARGTDGGKK